METQETGASTEEARTGDSSTDQQTENADGGTSGAGEQGNADQTDVESLRQQLSDKDSHISTLENELRALRKEEKPKKPAEQAPDDVTDWKIINSTRIASAGQAYLDEVAFLKQHKVPLSPDTLARALENAELRKGIKKGTKPQVEPAGEVQGEMRQAKPKDEIPERVRKLVPGITPEQYAQYKAEREAEKKLLGRK